MSKFGVMILLFYVILATHGTWFLKRFFLFLLCDV